MFEDEAMLRRVPSCMKMIGAIITGLQVLASCNFRQKPFTPAEADDQGVSSSTFNIAWLKQCNNVDARCTYELALA